MNKKVVIESNWVFFDQSEYDYFNESINNYPSLSRFINEWEMLMNVWLKHDTPNDSTGNTKKNNEFQGIDDMWVIKEEYYRLKKRVMDD